MSSEPQAAPEPEQAQQPPAPKQPYQSPRLTDLGPVEALTEQGSASGVPCALC
jgi:hypothetical protein